MVEYLIDKKKTYRTEITFGIETDTYDAGGKVVNRQDLFPCHMTG